MAHRQRCSLAALFTVAALWLTSAPATLPALAAQPAVSEDILSGTWRVSRTCLTHCVSPKPVLKVVHHLDGSVYVTEGSVRQLLYLSGSQVLVHGPKDSLMLTIRTRGQLMSGYGVGTDGSTFTTTWRCVAAPSSAALSGTTSASLGGPQPRSIINC
jgi:hypothetical protein